MRLVGKSLILLCLTNCSSDDGTQRALSHAADSLTGNQSDQSGSDSLSLAAATVTAVPIDDAINVKTYGAVGDGQADDTKAINNAAQAIMDTSFKGVVSAGGSTLVRSKELYFPSGHYKISGPINFKAPVMRVRSEGGATIRQMSASPIFVFGSEKGGSVKVKVQGLQFLYGTNQIYFTNANINGANLSIVDCEFHESTDYAVKAIGTTPDNHLSANVIIENSKFMNVAGALSNYADNAVVRDSWVQVGAPTLQPDSSVFYNGSGLLKLESSIFVPDITDSTTANPKVRVAGVHWVQIVGGSLYARDTKFGGEGAGYPIVRFDFNGTLSGGAMGSLAAYPYMGSTISIENSTICAGGRQTPDAAVININKGLPHAIRLVGNFGFTDSPYVRVNNPTDAQNYLNSAPNANVPQILLSYVFGPNMARPFGPTFTFPDDSSVPKTLLDQFIRK